MKYLQKSFKLCILILIFIIFLCIKCSADIFYYKVKKGDTLYKISKKFHVSIKVLKKLNHLKSSRIIVGQNLKIRVFKNNRSIKVIINVPYFYYKVKKGDSLYKIVKRFHTSLRLIKNLNHLNGNTLRPGQILKVPKIYVVKPIVVNVPGLINHKVRKGETLYSISLKYDVPVEIIKKLNHLNDNMIFEGQILKIPETSHKFSLKYPIWYYQQEIEKETLSKKLKELFLTRSILDKEEEQFLKDKFLEIARQFRRYKYKYGGDGNHGYLDCSMFVKLVYEELGILLPRTSREQYMVGIKVSKNELIPGDLIFFSKTRKKKIISHVGIYIGNHRFIHFCAARRGLAIDSLNSYYYKTHFVGAKRILNINLFKQICRLNK